MRFLAPILAISASLLLHTTALAQGPVIAHGGGGGEALLHALVHASPSPQGSGPRAVVLGAIPLDSDDRLDTLRALGCHSALPLVIGRAQGDDPDLIAPLASADALFIRGGDQSRYILWWRGTRTETLLHELHLRGAAIAGTSAGAAILGEYAYDARTGSLSALEALADARHPNLTLSPGLPALIDDVLFDTHFIERGRLPRLALMLAHLRATDNARPLGIALDARNFVTIDTPSQEFTVGGDSFTTLVRLREDSDADLPEGAPPTITHVRVDLLPALSRYSLLRDELLTTDPAPPTRDDAFTPALPLPRPLVIEGDRPGVTRIEALNVHIYSAAWSSRRTRGDNEPPLPPPNLDAAREAPLDARVGIDRLFLHLFSPDTPPADDSAFIPALRPVDTLPRFIVLLDAGSAVRVDEQGVLHVEPRNSRRPLPRPNQLDPNQLDPNRPDPVQPDASTRPIDAEGREREPAPPRSVVIIDTRAATLIRTGDLAAMAADGTPPPPGVTHALSGLTMHLLAPGRAINLGSGEIVAPSTEAD